MSTKQQSRDGDRVSTEDISSVLRDADAAFRAFNFDKYRERLRYAEALGKKFRNQEGL